MTEPNPDRISGTIAITVLPQVNGQYLCQMLPTLSDQSRNSREFFGQTPEHAIAIALEHLAEEYRSLAENRQNLDWDRVEQTESGEAIQKPYHVILHYERIGEAKSKFEAMEDTIMGNIVVENARITVIEVSPDIPINPMAREF
jgi:hypothetical protein